MIGVGEHRADQTELMDPVQRGARRDAPLWPGQRRSMALEQGASRRHVRRLDDDQYSMAEKSKSYSRRYLTPSPRSRDWAWRVGAHWWRWVYEPFGPIEGEEHDDMGQGRGRGGRRRPGCSKLTRASDQIRSEESSTRSVPNHGPCGTLDRYEHTATYTTSPSRIEKRRALLSPCPEGGKEARAHAPRPRFPVLLLHQPQMGCKSLGFDVKKVQKLLECVRIELTTFHMLSERSTN